MKLEKKIPTIQPSLLVDKFHFQDTEWIDFVPEFNDLFHIGRLEDYMDKISFPLPAHRKVVYDIIFLKEGSSVRSKGLNQYTFYKNEAFFLTPDQITSHKNLSEDVEGFFIHFSPTLFEENENLLKEFPFLGFLANPIVKIPEGKLEPILYLFERINDLYYRKDADLKILVWYLLVLLGEINHFGISANSKLEKISTAGQLTERYKGALSQYIHEKQTVSEYAELLHVTPNYLNRCIKKTINKTAQNLLNEMLILEAKSMLKYSGLSISEIAENLCQRSPSNFARFFKHQTGMSPKEYINNY